MRLRRVFESSAPGQPSKKHVFVSVEVDGCVGDGERWLSLQTDLLAQLALGRLPRLLYQT